VLEKRQIAKHYSHGPLIASGLNTGIKEAPARGEIQPIRRPAQRISLETCVKLRSARPSGVRCSDAGILVDAFEVMILPRRVRHSYRLARLFYRSDWIVLQEDAPLFPVGRWRQAFLGAFGPRRLFAPVPTRPTSMQFF